MLLFAFYRIYFPQCLHLIVHFIPLTCLFYLLSCYYQSAYKVNDRLRQLPICLLYLCIKFTHVFFVEINYLHVKYHQLLAGYVFKVVLQ